VSVFCFILFTHYSQRCIQRKVKSSQFHRRRTCSHTPSLDTSSSHQFSDVSPRVCLASSACLPISIVLARRVYRADGSQANRSPQRQVDRDVDQLTDRDTDRMHRELLTPSVTWPNSCVAILKLGCLSLLFVKPGIKVDGYYY